MLRTRDPAEQLDGPRASALTVTSAMAGRVMDERVRALLACPSCHRRLTDSANGLDCHNCSRSYPREAGRAPRLFPDSPEVSHSAARELYAKRRSPLLRLVKRILTPVGLTVRPTLHDRLRDRVVYGAPPDAIVLNFGSGTELMVADRRFVNFDIFPHPNAAVVGDGHHLPFLDGSFDVVWLSAVLEHIRKPWVVAEEVFRVLKPGGLVLLSVPFIQKRHGAPHDYFRYTVDGLRSLFDDFDEVEAGSSFTGPTGTLIHVAGAWMNAVLPGKLGFGLEVVVTRMLVWMKYLDLLVPPERLQAGVLTGGACYLGRRPEGGGSHPT